MRIILDANILFSAAKSAGAVRELLVRVEAAGHRLCADAFVETEAGRNIQAKAPLGLSALAALLTRVEVTAQRPDDLPGEIAVLLPEKVRPVLAAAIGMRCDVLVCPQYSP